MSLLLTWIFLVFGVMLGENGLSLSDTVISISCYLMRVLMCDKNDNFSIRIPLRENHIFLLHQLTSIKVKGSLIKDLNKKGGGGVVMDICIGSF